MVDYLSDFKFGPSTTLLSHRTYLFNDTNTSDRQYFYAPRIDVVNGSVPSIEELLSLHPTSQLKFAYDMAGNQKQRFYCPDDSNCSEPTPPAGKSAKTKNSVAQENEESERIEEQLRLYPNPTKGIIYIKIEPELLERVEFIKVYASNSALVKNLQKRSSNLQLDLIDVPNGVYFLHIHMNDGSGSITRKIIKE